MIIFVRTHDFVRNRVAILVVAISRRTFEIEIDTAVIIIERFCVRYIRIDGGRRLKL